MIDLDNMGSTSCQIVLEWEVLPFGCVTKLVGLGDGELDLGARVIDQKSTMEVVEESHGEEHWSSEHDDIVEPGGGWLHGL
jgi:hypothetical protein